MKRSVSRLAGVLCGLLLVSSASYAGSMSAFLLNEFIDAFMRGQSFSFPTTVYIALATGTGSVAGCGTEVVTTLSGVATSYVRIAVTANEASWAGTQGAGTTSASSGADTSGAQTSNNAAITFTPGPTANWGTIVEVCVMDAITGGHTLWRTPLTASKTVNGADSAPSFSPGSLTWTIN